MKRFVARILPLLLILTFLPVSSLAAVKSLSKKDSTFWYSGSQTSTIQSLSIQSHSFVKSYSYVSGTKKVTHDANSGKVILLIKAIWANSSFGTVYSNEIAHMHVIYNGKEYTGMFVPVNTKLDYITSNFFSAMEINLRNTIMLELYYTVSDLPQSAKTSGDLKVVFTNDKYDPIAEYIIRGPGAKIPASINVTAKSPSVSLRNSNGAYQSTIPQGKTFTITDYNTQYGMFEAEYNGETGYVKGTGLSISYDELYDSFN